MESLVIGARNRARDRFKEAGECIGELECHDAFDIADAPAPFHAMIGGWTEDAFYYHRPRARHNEQAILIFALEAERAGKAAAIGQPRLHGTAPVDAGCRMPAAGQGCDMRRRTAA